MSKGTIVRWRLVVYPRNPDFLVHAADFSSQPTHRPLPLREPRYPQLHNVSANAVAILAHDTPPYVAWPGGKHSGLGARIGEHLLHSADIGPALELLGLARWIANNTEPGDLCVLAQVDVEAPA